jgi:hypothetical protein
LRHPQKCGAIERIFVCLFGAFDIAHFFFHVDYYVFKCKIASHIVYILTHRTRLLADATPHAQGCGAVFALINLFLCAARRRNSHATPEAIKKELKCFKSISTYTGKVVRGHLGRVMFK